MKNSKALNVSQLSELVSEKNPVLYNAAIDAANCK